MAWNDGGDKNNDPWSGGNKNQGPPDLDEALKKFQEKLNGFLGGRPNSGDGSGGNGGLSAAAIGFLAIVAIVAWAAFGIYQVDEKERSVVLHLGTYKETKGPGLRWNMPFIDKWYIVNTTEVRTTKTRGLMLTEDENIVEVSMSVQYTVDDPAANVLEIKSAERSMEHALDSALRHVVGSTKMDQVITDGREQVAVETQRRLQRYLNDYRTGFKVTKVNIEDAQAPKQVQDAFDNVTRAKEDKERLRNEADGYANAIIPEARGAAQRQLEEAEAYRQQVIARAEGEAARFSKLLTEYQKAPAVTRERLYIDALQEVYSNAGKIMVDVEGGNQMLYLPLDKLAEQQRAASGATNLSEAELRVLTDRVIAQLSRDTRDSGSSSTSTTRRREAR